MSARTDEENDIELRTRLLERIERSDSATVERVYSVLKSVGIDAIAEEIDFMKLSGHKNIESQLIAVLHKIAYGRMPPRSNTEDQTMRWRRYRATLPTSWLSDIEWVRRKRGAASVALSRRIRACAANGWPVHRIVYVRPSSHYGTPVGRGLFALVPLLKGQMLMQFTGSVHTHSASFVKHKKRRDYVLLATYGDVDFVVNPLANEDAIATVGHVAGYINEPSRPPWKRGDSIVYDGRSRTVSRYAHTTGTYTLLGDQGDVERARAVDVSHTTDDRPDRDAFESNTLWYDFPVPLRTLYRPTRQRRGGAYVYRRVPRASITAVDWARKGFEKRFKSFTDCKTGIFQTQANTRLRKGFVVFMNDALFRGLERYGLVINVGSHTVTVQHYLLADVAWRLPQTTLVGKLHVCPACREADDPTCTRCTVVPFPVIHACRNIAADEELLCLYGSRIASRGLPCRSLLRDDEWKPRWDDH